SLWITIDPPVERLLSRPTFPVKPAPFQRFERQCAYGGTSTGYPQAMAWLWTKLEPRLCTERFHVKQHPDVHRVMHSSGQSRHLKVRPGRGNSPHQQPHLFIYIRWSAIRLLLRVAYIPSQRAGPLTPRIAAREIPSSHP